MRIFPFLSFPTLHDPGSQKCQGPDFLFRVTPVSRMFEVSMKLLKMPPNFIRGE